MAIIFKHKCFGYTFVTFNKIKLQSLLVYRWSLMLKAQQAMTATQQGAHNISPSVGINSF